MAQQAWIQNATVRENILFLSKYDEAKYKAVLEACALQPDLNILPAGDQTEVAEITLSGGQKQRVAIARACYTQAGLYLLDDPLSALDAHVSRHIFDQVIGPRGMLRHATRILVTHRISVLSKCDYIYVMKDGKIVESGTFNELIANDKQEGNFSELLSNYLVTHETENSVDEENMEGNHHFRRFSDNSIGAANDLEDEYSGVYGSDDVGSACDMETQIRRKVLTEVDIDETELFINSCFKEIDELSDDEEDNFMNLKPKAKRVVSFVEMSQLPSGQSSLASSVPSTLSRASVRSASSTKAIYPKELANATQIQPEGRVTLHQNTTIEQSAPAQVTMSCYYKYFKRLGLLACSFILLFQFAQLFCNIAAAQWLSIWSEGQLIGSDKPIPSDNYSKNLKNLGIYIIFGLGECIFTLFTTLIISFSTLKTAKLLHADMLSR